MVHVCSPPDASAVFLILIFRAQVSPFQASAVRARVATIRPFPVRSAPSPASTSLFLSPSARLLLVVYVLSLADALCLLSFAALLPLESVLFHEIFAAHVLPKNFRFFAFYIFFLAVLIIILSSMKIFTLIFANVRTSSRLRLSRLLDRL